jgi:hypothetical protein
MQKKISIIIIVLTCIVLTYGCAHISGGVAPSTIPLTPGTYKTVGEVKGEDCVYRLLGIIPLSAGNETRSAVRNAIAEASAFKAIALIDVSVDTYTQSFILFGWTCTQVYGTAVVLQ